MLKALAVKELRETAWIGAIALAVNLAIVSNLIGLGLFTWAPVLPGRREGLPFVSDLFASSFIIVTVLFTIALGFRQSAWEAGKGTYLFLLHRPLRRETVFLTKLATGFLLIQVCGAVPILLYAWWAAVPENHPSPFAWSMTWPTWEHWLELPLLYLGAFLSGLRPARWFGTRLLPLVACTLLVGSLSVFGWGLVLWLAAVIPAYILLIMTICNVARLRDY